LNIARLGAASTLELVAERKLGDLLGELAPPRLEASGVCIKDGSAIVVFDNLARIARVELPLGRGAPSASLVGLPGRGIGFEGISWDCEARRYYVLTEENEHPDGRQAMVEVYDERLILLERNWGGIPLASKNKGGEGIAYLRRGDDAFLLGLCEGNKCHAGKKGRKPGGGRILVFMKTPAGWVRRETVKLPKSLWFEDYSGLDVRGDRMAVVSQASSALWVGRLAEEAWRCNDEGEIYLFPRDSKDRIRYCNVEGVAWLDESHVVVVSDRRKRSQRRRCARLDQSIHVFRLHR
jgi:hypothetical protein